MENNNEGRRFEIQNIDKEIKKTKREISICTLFAVLGLIGAGRYIPAAVGAAEMATAFNLDPMVLLAANAVVGMTNLNAAKTFTKDLGELEAKQKIEEQEGRSR